MVGTQYTGTGLIVPHVNTKELFNISRSDSEELFLDLVYDTGYVKMFLVSHDKSDC